VVPNLGRTGSSIIVKPTNVASQKLEDNPPRVEYKFTVFDTGELTVDVFLSPTQDFKKYDV